MSLSALQEIIDSGIKLTPMMEQYYSIKKNYPDTLLLFRMGDFYELFFDDAKQAAKLLDITLTHRGKLGNFPIPMSGIPHHAASNYIDRLTKQGIKAVICEQIQDPKDAVGIVKRGVTQIVSPGMPYDLDKTESKDNRFIVCGSYTKNSFYLVIIDFTVGDFRGIKTSSEEDFINNLKILSPKEMVTFMGQWEDFPAIEQFLKDNNILLTHLGPEYFSPKHTSIYIEKIIPFYQNDKIIKLHSGIISPIGALTYYIQSTQNSCQFVHVKPFRMEKEDGRMKVTSSTLKGLEIIPKHPSKYNDSLLGFFDKTKTAMGTRSLKNVFLTPLADLNEIKERQNIVSYLLSDIDRLKKIRDLLGNIRDLERIMAKISTSKVTATDLINLSGAISNHSKIKELIKEIPPGLEKLQKKDIAQLEKLAISINKTINDEIGASFEKGNLIKPGCNQKRDRLANFSLNATNEMLKLEAQYRKETGIPNLKIKSNNVAGHFIEVSKSHLSKVPKSFNRRQTLVNSERFMTKELANFEKEIVLAKERLEQLEREIFKEVVEQVKNHSGQVLKLAKIISFLDIFQSFAWIALQEEMTRPEIDKSRRLIHIEGGWHPLIKAQIKEQFVAHDLHLDENAFFGLITGPNMAGKTTVMREVAIIQLLAQIGSCVPARRANLGICDYLFSRLGASDDITRGQSTFMVEMTETAEILRHASSRSLIILDEVGRGTSTYDGLSIAWSLVEHFVNKTKALTLFATHYHELIDVVSNLPGAKNLTVETFCNNGEVEFLYRLIEQGAAESFGIYVAKLAGIPQSILKRSQNILVSLEEEHGKEQQLEFFHNNPQETLSSSRLQKLEDDISNLDLLNTTPIQAIQKLHEMKNLLIQ